MSKSLVYSAVKQEFPVYKIINILEVGVPIFKKSAKCLATVEKGLPIVQEFTLKLVHLEYDISEISEMLALDLDLVQSAYYSLIQLELIDFKTRKLSEKGREVLNKSKYSNLEMTEVSLSINSYTGHIYKNGNFIRSNKTKKMNLFTIKPILSKSDENLVDYTKVRSIFKKIKKEEDSEFEGNLVEISKITNKADEFYKVYLVILETPEKEVRLLAYDLDYQLEDLELKLKQGDLQGIKYFVINKEFLKEMENLIFFHDVEKVEMDYFDILDISFLESDYSQLEITLPLYDYFIPNDGWIDALTGLLKAKTNVIINFTGNYSNTYQRDQVNKLINLQNESKLLKINHNVDFQLPCLCINKNEGYIIKPVIYELDLATNKHCMTTEIYKIKEVKNDPKFNKEEMDIELLNKQSFKISIKKLIIFVKELDNLMNEYYGIGWLINNRCNNEYLLDRLDLAKDLNSFTTFTAQLYGCIGEIIKDLGERENKKSYFFNDFKERVPLSQDAMNRLRVYRNSVQHSQLDANQVQQYLKYIKEDLNGTFPEFLEKGYLILQTKIVKNLIDSIEHEIRLIKKELQETY